MNKVINGNFGTECPFTPFGSYIIVRMHSQEEKSIQGLYLPNTKETGVCKAVVMATNSGRWIMDGTSKVPSSAQAGDIVYFFKQNAFEIPHTGFFLVPEEILLCKDL